MNDGLLANSFFIFIFTLIVLDTQLRNILPMLPFIATRILKAEKYITMARKRKQAKIVLR